MSDLERVREGEGGPRYSSVAGCSFVWPLDCPCVGKLNGRPGAPADPAPGRKSDAGCDAVEFAEGSGE